MSLEEISTFHESICLSLSTCFKGRGDMTPRNTRVLMAGTLKNGPRSTKICLGHEIFFRKMRGAGGGGQFFDSM